MVSVPLAFAATLTVKPNTLEPLVAAMAVELVQVMTLLDAEQLQSAEFVPLNVTVPLAMLMPVGNTSTTVIVPVVAAPPVLLTVKV